MKLRDLDANSTYRVLFGPGLLKDFRPAPEAFVTPSLAPYDITVRLKVEELRVINDRC